MQRLFEASRQAAEGGGGHGGAVEPLADDAVFKVNRSRPNWMMPQNEESPERRPLFDRGLELIAEVRVNSRVFEHPLVSARRKGILGCLAC